MITITQTYCCPNCDSPNIIKNGKDYKGAQKYHCHHCGAYGTLEATGRYSNQDRELVLRAYQERVSTRGIQRVFGVVPKTLSQWLAQKADELPDLAETLAPAQADDVLELDELWSFVLKKSNKRWVWIALCRRARQVVAYYIGDRSKASCRQLWQRIPKPYTGCLTYSDFWDAYQKVFPKETHRSVGKQSGQTAHVERWNNTLRQRIARFVRKTLSFSKSDRFHALVLKLFIHHYNSLCFTS